MSDTNCFQNVLSQGSFHSNALERQTPSSSCRLQHLWYPWGGARAGLEPQGPWVSWRQEWGSGDQGVAS